MVVASTIPFVDDTGTQGPHILDVDISPSLSCTNRLSFPITCSHIDFVLTDTLDGLNNFTMSRLYVAACHLELHDLAVQINPQSKRVEYGASDGPLPPREEFASIAKLSANATLAQTVSYLCICWVPGSEILLGWFNASPNGTHQVIGLRVESWSIQPRTYLPWALANSWYTVSITIFLRSSVSLLRFVERRYLLEALNMYPPSAVVPSSAAAGFSNAQGAMTFDNTSSISLKDLEKALANMTAAMFWAGASMTFFITSALN